MSRASGCNADGAEKVQGNGNEENKTEGTGIDLMSVKPVSRIDLNVG